MAEALRLAREESSPNRDVETEGYLVGALLIDSTGVAIVSPLLKHVDFYSAPLATVYRAILELDEAGEPVDYVSVGRWLTQHERLESVGGTAFLFELTDAVPTTAHIESHALALAGMAAVRRAGKAAQEALQASQRTGRPEDLHAAVEAIGEALEGHGEGGPRRLSSGLEDAFDRLESDTTAGAGLAGLTTGYRDLDALTSGWKPGQLVVVAARPGVGKTAIALGMMRGSAKHGAALFMSLEMPEAELVDRLLSGEGSVDNERMKHRMLTQEDATALTAAADRLDRLPVYVSDDPVLTPSKLHAAIRRTKKVAKRAGHVLRLVIVDHIGLMKGDGKPESREREVATITRSLKEYAKREGVTIIALCQLNREGAKRKDPRPKLSDLRESGAIEQDGDIVLMIHRPEVDKPEDESLRGVAELLCVKHRGGPLDTIRLVYEGRYTRFRGRAHEARGEAA